MSAAAADAPSLLQIGVAVGACIGGIIVTVLAYLHKRKQAAPGNDVAVLSASFADKATVDRLLHGMDSLKRSIDDAGDRRHRDSMEEREANDRNTAAIRDWTAKRAEMVNAMGLGDAGNLPPEWLAMIRRLGETK